MLRSLILLINALPLAQVYCQLAPTFKLIQFCSSMYCHMAVAFTSLLACCFLGGCWWLPLLHLSFSLNLVWLSCLANYCLTIGHISFIFQPMRATHIQCTEGHPTSVTVGGHGDVKRLVSFPVSFSTSNLWIKRWALNCSYCHAFALPWWTPNSLKL